MKQRTQSSKRPTKEWTAEVENEIMRLYENGFNTNDFPTHPTGGIVQVKQQVDSKVTAADQTPNYVLALANLFRRRMQVLNRSNGIINIFFQHIRKCHSLIARKA